MDRELVRLRAEQPALDADGVAEVEQLEDAEVAFGHRVLPHVGLNAVAAIGKDEEIRLSETPDPENASRGHRARLLALELLAGLAAVRADQGRHRVGPVE